MLLAPGGRGRVGGADGAAVLQRAPDGGAVVAAHGVAVVQPRPDPEPVDGAAVVQPRPDPEPVDGTDDVAHHFGADHRLPDGDPGWSR